MKKLNFFDRQVHCGLQVNVGQVSGSAEHIWIGESGGIIRRLERRPDKQLGLSSPVQAFDIDLAGMCVARDGLLLLAVGTDHPAGAATSMGARYKVFDTRRVGPVGEVACQVLVHRVCASRGPEYRATCVTATKALTHIAVGTETGAVHIFRGKDLAQEKPAPIILSDESAGDAGGAPVTAVHFLEQRGRTVLFASSAASVRSWSVQEGDFQEIRLLNVDPGGAVDNCSCVFPSLNALLVARGDAVFSYDPDAGNMAAMPMDGVKEILVQYGSYFIAVTTETAGAVQSGYSPAPRTLAKQVTICLHYPGMRFIAYQSQFTDVTHVVVGLGSIFIFSKGGADGSTVPFELQEKPLAEQLKILVSKRMFEWAASIALQRGAPGEATADIYKQHGDALFTKRAYDQALDVYMKTVDLGLPLEPSYVVERYLDAQRIGHVAKYLKRLHERNMAEREHTALLLQCYTKLNKKEDFSTLEHFIETTPVEQYDAATAIEVLETAGIYDLAARVATTMNNHDEYVRISLEQFKNHDKTADHIRSLGKNDAIRILRQHGRTLMRHAPDMTIGLVEHTCGLKSHGNTEEGRDHLDDLLLIFADDPEQLMKFLRGVLSPPGGSRVPVQEAERLFPTLLELLLRCHQSVSAMPNPSEAQLEEAANLAHEIMSFVRQYQSGRGLTSTLMLCQTYDFVDGFFFAAEGLGRYQLLANWCFQHRDAKRLLDVCKRCGCSDQSLWVQALSFLSADDEEHLEELLEVLKHIEESDLMPLLMVLESLQASPALSLGSVRTYLQGQFRRMVESVETSAGRADQDRQEIGRMQQDILSLRTTAKEFQNTSQAPKCFQCSLTLEVPATHFFCGHSYHSYCVPADGGCPKCSSEASPPIKMKEQRLERARNVEDFFKYLQGGSGEGGVEAVAEFCKLGAFDAANDLAAVAASDADQD